jgi:hypothetical protein
MSLTQMLRTPNHPVTHWLHTTFPGDERWRATWRAATSGLPTLAPPSTRRSYPWVLVGQAVDYRLRLLAAGYAAADTVAAHGARLAVTRRPAIARLWLALAHAWDALAAAGPVRPGPQDARLIPLAVGLSWFETCYRSGVVPAALQTAVHLPDLTIPSDVVADVTALVHHVDTADPARWRLPAVLNPTFAGSADVGGADGDVILGTTLIDFKTTIHPREGAAWVYQLLGYGLLDYPDAYRLTGAGVLLVRQTRWLTWTWPELITLMGSDPHVPWSDYQAAFRAVVRATRRS